MQELIEECFEVQYAVVNEVNSGDRPRKLALGKFSEENSAASTLNMYLINGYTMQLFHLELQLPFEPNTEFRRTTLNDKPQLQYQLQSGCTNFI